MFDLAGNPYMLVPVELGDNVCGYIQRPKMAKDSSVTVIKCWKYKIKRSRKTKLTSNPYVTIQVLGGCGDIKPCKLITSSKRIEIL